MPTAAPNTPAAPKPSRGRIGGVAKWVCLALCALSGWLWYRSDGRSMSWWCGVDPKTSIAAHCVYIARGEIQYSRASVVIQTDFRSGLPHPDTSLWKRPGWWPRWVQIGPRFWFSLPLWIPLVLAGVPAVVLWYPVAARLLRRRAGLCAKCGYDRAGLRDNACCPECGAPAPDRPKVSAPPHRAASDTDRMSSAARNAPAAPKTSRGRGRRVARWAGLLVCVGIAVAHLISFRDRAVWSSPRTFQTKGPPIQVHWIVLEGGAVRYERASVQGYSNDTAWIVEITPPVSWWRPQWRAHRQGQLIVAPLWLIFLPFSVATGILWYRDHRFGHRRRESQCVNCGYDRAGLSAESPCPECGAAGCGVAKAKT